MGRVVVPVRLSHPERLHRKRTEKALVDTGATFTVLPASLGRALGLQTIGKTRVRTAGKRTPVTMVQSYAYVEVDGKRTVTPVLLNPHVDRVLVGVITLEALGLTVDPTARRLKPAEILLLRTTPSSTP